MTRREINEPFPKHFCPCGQNRAECRTLSKAPARGHFLIVLGLLLWLAVPAWAAQRNVLLIIADDIGADSSSLYNSTNTGASLPPMPTINSLAQRGVVFRNAWACPECSPTRASIITGRYPFRTGIGDALSMGDPPLSANEYTLPKAFSNSAPAYHLAQFGKFHLALGPNTPRTVGGWSNYAGCLPGAVASYTNWTKTSNGVQTAGYTNYATSDVVTDATNWINGRGANPWFAWVAFNAPHTPFHVPPTNLCPGYASNTNTANRRQFEAMTEAVDTEIARLLTAVDTNNTHIIFLGDNGTPNSILQPPYPSGRGKSSLYQGGVRVPFFIAGPDVVSPGRTNDTPVHAVDLFATILELAGINTASALAFTTNAVDSKSLLPVLQNQPDTARYTFTEYYSTNAMFTANSGRAIRNSDYKLIRLTNGTELLYNLTVDPYEGTNLHPAAVGTAARSNYNALVMRLGDYQSLLTAPTVTNQVLSNRFYTATVARDTTVNYQLWRATNLSSDLQWSQITNATITTNGTTNVTLRDTNATTTPIYYKVMAVQP